MVQKSLVRVKHGNVEGPDLYEGEERSKGTIWNASKCRLYRINVIVLTHYVLRVLIRVKSMITYRHWFLNDSCYVSN